VLVFLNDLRKKWATQNVCCSISETVAILNFFKKRLASG
jgi:hypothetical protein